MNAASGKPASPPSRGQVSTASRAFPAASRCIDLPYQAPFAWQALIAFLRVRGAPQVEGLWNGHYVRAVALKGHIGWCAIAHAPHRGALRLRYAPTLEPVADLLCRRLRDWFDLDANSTAIDAALGADALLRERVRACPGLRVPGAFDGFELALRTVLGQQVSVRGATTLYGRFVERFGIPVEAPFAGITRTPPDAAGVAAETVDALARLGLPRRRAETVRQLATLVASGDLAVNRTVDPIEVRRQLLAVPGIGPWTVEYLAMRGLRDADAFPASDLGVLHSLGVKTARQAQQRSLAWCPWRAYAVMHLWHAASGG